MKENKQFEEWLKPNPLDHGRYGQLLTNTFDNMPFAFKWGVYLEFFDSVGIFIGTERKEVPTNTGPVIIHEAFASGLIDPWATRQEAQQAAIKKAFQILEQ